MNRYIMISDEKETKENEAEMGLLHLPHPYVEPFTPLKTAITYRAFGLLSYIFFRIHLTSDISYPDMLSLLD